MSILMQLRKLSLRIVQLALVAAAASAFGQANPHGTPSATPRKELIDTQAPPIELRTNRVELTPERDDALIAKVTAYLLTQHHYLKKPFNAEVSSRFLDQYMDALDPAHMLFFQSDLSDFEIYRNSLDRRTKKGDTSPADMIFNRYLERIDQQATYVQALLKTNVFGFDTNERYSLNRKDAPRPKDLAEAQGLWRDRVRFEYLQEKLDGKKPQEIKNTVLRRYARTQRFLKEWDDSDVLQLYLTSLAHVYDPHSDYMSGPTMDNFNIYMRLSLFGIGALLESVDGYCVIKELTPGGPAIKSGKLKPGDKIIAVAQGDEEPVEVVDMKLTKVVEMIRGPKNTKVRLTLIPALAANSSERRTVVLVRDEIHLEAREAKAQIIELSDTNKTRLGVIDLPSFYTEFPSPGKTNNLKSTTTDVARLLKKLKKENVAGVILDLRHNGGGSLEEAIRLTGLFITEGPVVQVKDRDDAPIPDYDPDPSVAYDGPLIVLTSRFSASASEILAGALQDYGRALIVGDSSTHGKGTVQQLLPLDTIIRQSGLAVNSNPGALKITIRKFYLPNGASTQKVGVTPDIVLPSVNNYADVGESSLPNCLDWDTVPSAKFQPLNRIQPYLAELKRRSAQRVAKDEDFGFVREDIERFKKGMADKSVSLNEAQRRKEKDEVDAIQKARKKEWAKRAPAKETVYEITLKQVDLPGLPSPLVKTNAFAQARPTNGSSPEGAKKTNAVKVVVSNAATANSATNSAALTQSALQPTKAADSSSDEDASLADEESPLTNLDLKESERILADLILLSHGKPPVNGVANAESAGQ